MSPEIRWGEQYFDGHAVDVWALGPILYLMTTGFPPFEIADNSDERFQYFTSGYLRDVVYCFETVSNFRFPILVSGMPVDEAMIKFLVNSCNPVGRGFEYLRLRKTLS